MMSDESNAPATPQSPEIVEPSPVPIVFTDWIISAGAHDGIVNIALGTIDHSRKRSEEELARVVVASRMRFSREFAYRPYILLGDFLGFPRPEAEGGTQPPPPTPQKGMLN
jgi:hypothetical protein